MAVRLLLNFLIIFLCATMLRIATLNIQGFRNSQKRLFLYQYLIQQNLDIIALQEVHLSKREVKQWGNDWEGQSLWHAGGTYRAGVALLFRKNLDIKAEIIDQDFNGSILCAKITYENFTFQILNVYGPGQETRDSCNNFFDEGYQFLQPNLPVIMCGDFNMVEDLEMDRHGGRPRPLHTWGMESLQKIKNDFQLVDIWRHRHPNKKQFTWHCPHVGKDIRSRLDRFYASSQICENLNEVVIEPFSWSDHETVIMEFSLPGQTQRGPGYWKLNTTLLKDQDYLNLVKDFWEGWRLKKSEFSSISQWWDFGKRRIQQISIWFSIEKKKLQNARREDLVNRLQRARTANDPDPDTMRDLGKQLKNFEKYQAQKIFIATKLDKIELDEKPSAYFFDLLKKRQENNYLNEVYVTAPDGTTSVSQETEDILSATTSFYKRLYKAESDLHKPSQNSLLKHISKTLNTEEQQSLDRDFTKQEIREALHSMENDKTPGWDGLPYEFYKTFWSLLEPDFYELQHHILNVDEKLSASQQRALISLLYKDGDKKDIKNWRPLSLLCTDYKILAKAISNRMRRVLASVVHLDQTCSVPGRSIHANLFLTRDIIRYTNHKRYKGFLLTVDQEKAFDRVDRDLLFKILKKMNFGEKFLKRLKILYDDPKVAMYVNGHIGETFITTRGIRQGCPLSAILYVLFIESLGQFIRANKLIHGMKLPGTTEETKLAQYADDLTFYLSHRTNLKYLFEALYFFERASGSKIKPTKTQAICLGGAQPQPCPFEIKWQDEKGIIILGVTFFTDPLHTTNHNWKIQCQRLQDQIESSKRRQLSFRGKVILLNSKLLAPFWYLGTVYPLPTWYENYVNKLIFGYIWGDGKLEAIKRETLFLPKNKGGLGIFQPKKQSLALRAKYVENIIDTSSSLKWTNLARYYIGFQLGALTPEWRTLRDNRYPKPDHNLYPEYYGDVLKLIEKLDITNVKWSTKYFYDTQISMENKLPKAQEQWPRIRPLTYNWPNPWMAVWTSFSPGRYQEIHFKFLHLAIPTNEKLHKWTSKVVPNANCKQCLLRQNPQIETDIHLFFSCPNAFGLWKWVKTIIMKLLPNHPARCFVYSMNIFPDDVPNNIRKLVLTLIQITMHQIWVNRNSNLTKPDSDLISAIAQIRNEFLYIILSIHKKHNEEHRLVVFRKNFCQNNQLISLGADNSIEVDFG